MLPIRQGNLTVSVTPHPHLSKLHIRQPSTTFFFHSFDIPPFDLPFIPHLLIPRVPTKPPTTPYLSYRHSLISALSRLRRSARRATRHAWRFNRAPHSLHISADGTVQYGGTLAEKGKGSHPSSSSQSPLFQVNFLPSLVRTRVWWLNRVRSLGPFSIPVHNPFFPIVSKLPLEPNTSPTWLTDTSRGSPFWTRT